MRLPTTARRLVPPVHWLRPDGGNLAAMQSLVKQAIVEQRTHLEFMLHSSELMPGGSPTFRTVDDIEKLYGDLEALFPLIASGFTGETLCGFTQHYKGHLPR